MWGPNLYSYSCAMGTTNVKINMKISFVIWNPQKYEGGERKTALEGTITYPRGHMDPAPTHKKIHIKTPLKHTHTKILLYIQN